MENTIHIDPIGSVKVSEEGFSIQLKEKYIPALTNIKGFSHLQILWWGNLFDISEYRSKYVADKPYVKGPDKLGIFSTRSQIRPNPILLTTIFVQEINLEKGIIKTPYIDTEPDTPVLDIKPYYPFDRVKECNVPDWCKHWPEWYEETASFNWQDEFNF